MNEYDMKSREIMINIGSGVKFKAVVAYHRGQDHLGGIPHQIKLWLTVV